MCLLVEASFRPGDCRRLRAVQPAVDGPSASVPAVARIQPDDDPAGTVAALEPVCGVRIAPSCLRPERGVRSISTHCLPREQCLVPWHGWPRDGSGSLDWGCSCLRGSWGCGYWGRWFAGLVYPFCGFLIVWLLYPVTPVAIWLPWLLLASDRSEPTRGQAGGDARGRRRSSDRGWAHSNQCARASGRRTVCLLADHDGVVVVARSWAAHACLGRGDRSGPDPGCRADHPAGLLSCEKPGLGRPPARDEGMVGACRGPAYWMPSCTAFPLFMAASVAASPIWHAGSACIT